jgi:glycosyltransferase involved in cell wall biosynthesis
MNNQPLISVLMAVYNGEVHLRESIDSVLGQTYANFEFIIINDGSADSTEKIILSYPDERIRYEKNEINSGLIATLNRGLAFTTGKYILRMDADDICFPKRFEKQVQFMEANPEIGICGSCADVIDKTKKMRYDADDVSIRVKMLYQCHMLHPSIIVRKELMDKHNLRYNPQYAHAEDYELFYRIGKLTKLANLQEPLLLYREHEESVSRKNKEIQKANSLKVIKQQFRDIGMDVSESEIDLFKDVMNSRFDFSEVEIYKIETLVQHIIATNHHSKKLHEATLAAILFQKWKDILMNITRFGTSIYRLAMNSRLSKYGTFSTTEKAKLFIKSLLKY